MSFDLNRHYFVANNLKNSCMTSLEDQCSLSLKINRQYSCVTGAVTFKEPPPARMLKLISNAFINDNFISSILYYTVMIKPKAF